MKKQFMILPGFLTTSRMVCAVLVLALALGTMAGCKPTEDITVSSPPAPSVEPTEQPSADPSLELSEPPAPSVPASDVISLPPAQPTAQPPAQSTPPSGPPAQAAFPEIVLSERSLNIPVPDFLDKDQQRLYRQAFEIYTSLFGGDTSGVCMGDEDKFPDMADFVERNGIPYTKATGRYAVWADFDAMIHSVFTDHFWAERDADTIFVNIDGALYFLNAAKGHYYRNENFPDTFNLNSKTDDEIIFTLTGYYSSPWPNEGETFEQRDQRLLNGWEYIIDFEIKLVRTAEGWRFEHFNSTAADEKAPEELMAD